MTVNYSPVVAKEWKSYFFMLFGLAYPSLVKHFRTNAYISHNNIKSSIVDIDVSITQKRIMRLTRCKNDGLIINNEDQKSKMFRIIQHHICEDQFAKNIKA